MPSSTPTRSRLPSIKTSSPPPPATTTTSLSQGGPSSAPTSSGSASRHLNNRSPHPMMSYYVPPNGMHLPSSSTSSPLSPYSNNTNTNPNNPNNNNSSNGGLHQFGHLGNVQGMGYGTSGFAIPTSNSRPTSPKGYGGDDMGSGSGSGSGSGGQRFGVGGSTAGRWGENGGGRGGGGGGGGGGNGSSSASSSPLHQNQTFNGIPSVNVSISNDSNTHGNGNVGSGMMGALNSTSSSNREPPSKKRRLSGSNPQNSYHLPPPAPYGNTSNNNNTTTNNNAAPSNFLAGLRGASDLPSPSHPSSILHNQNNGMVDDEDDDEGDSGDESDDYAGGGRSGSVTGGGGHGRNEGEGGGKGKKKMKLTRGSRACTVCRRLKMKCVEADIDNGVRCLRCRNGNLECVFEESMRGKRSSKGKKSEIMAKNLKDMENTLDTVLRSLHNPKLSLASGMTNLSPSASSGMMDGSPAQGGNRALDMTSPGRDLMGAEQLDAQKPYTDMSVSHPARPGISPLGGGGGDNSAGSPLMGRPGAGLSRMNTSTSNVTSGASGNAVAGSTTGGSKNGPPSPRLHSLPDNTLNPLGLLAEASLQNRKRSATNVNLNNLAMDGPGQTIESGLNGADALKSRVGGSKARTRESSVDDSGNPKRLGVGDASYFRPGPMSSLGLRRVIIERELKPEIFSFTSAAQINELFDIFFDKLHPNVPVLNKELHTPAGVCARSPFLLTTICAIASRFHPKHSGLRPKLAAVAKKLMFESPARGYKSLEIVQAYLLLVNWTLGPEERWEQDLSYLLLGMAIRIGTDMNLYKRNVVMPLDTEEGRLRDIEIANRERTWLLCFIHDRSQSAQMGRPYSIREDAIIRESRYPSWFTRASSQPEDVVLAAYADMQRIMSRALDSLYSQQTTNSSGLVPGVDYPLVVNAVLDQLDGWLREWQFPLVEPANNEITVHMQILYRAMADYYHQYNSLVLSSFALQYAIETSPLDLPIWFSKVYTAAMGVLTVVKIKIAPRGLLPSFTDGQMVMFCYACLSLLKLIRPEFKQLNGDPQTILNSLNEAIDTLSAAAVDEVHSVGLYATLLRNLVGNKQEELRTDWNAAEKERRGTRHSRSATTLATVCNGALTMRGNDDEGLLWNPYVGLGTQSLPQPAQTMPGLNGTPVIVPDNADNTNNQPNDMPGSGQGAMNGTIWPHAAVSSAPTPTAEIHHDPTVHNGMQDASGMFMDGLGAVSYGLEDINWENSLLMPGFGGFGQLELSGGFVHTQFGSGIISPNIGMTPAHSRPASPRHMMHQHPH